MTLKTADFDFIRKMVYEQSAIVLEPGKEYLVEARILPLAQKEGLENIEKLVSEMKRSKFNGLNRKVIEAMTTNETSFFRDIHPFETLKKEVVPRILENRKATKELNIWCGASSSGQEPYSIAFTLKENFPELIQWKVNFFASDISEQMLTKCRDGRYSQLEINRGLPAPLLVKYFKRDGLNWQIIDNMRKSITFMEINLASHWPVLPRMDIIFLRNVMIYFDVETKKEIFFKLQKLLASDGYLFLGAGETTLNLNENFKRTPFAQSGCYILTS